MDFQTQSSFNSSAELARANTYTSKPIRLLHFHGRKSSRPTERPGAQGAGWSTVSSSSVATFSAVCWFGGRDTLDYLDSKIPIGLIETNVGGTGVEFWSPEDSIAECSQVTPSTKGPSGNDASLYNGWIYPFTVGPMALSSLIWYQGESNTCPQSDGRPCGGTYYACQFRSMIKHWKAAFGNASLPFAFVLLAPDQKQNAVADIRWAQLTALNISHTAVVNAIDDGDCTPQYCAVHVRDKQLIGQRLKDVLLGLVYHGMDVYMPAQTPFASSWALSTCKGHGATVRFEHVGSGLVLLQKPTDGRQVVCGGNTTKWSPSDGHVVSGGTNWWPVNASLCAGFEVQVGGIWSAASPTVGVDGSSLVFCGSASPIKGVRYAQSDWPLVTLYSKQGQPAAPFSMPHENFVGPH